MQVHKNSAKYNFILIQNIIKIDHDNNVNAFINTRFWLPKLFYKL